MQIFLVLPGNLSVGSEISCAGCGCFVFSACFGSDVSVDSAVSSGVRSAIVGDLDASGVSFGSDVRFAFGVDVCFGIGSGSFVGFLSGGDSLDVGFASGIGVTSGIGSGCLVALRSSADGSFVGLGSRVGLGVDSRPSYVFCRVLEKYFLVFLKVLCVFSLELWEKFLLAVGCLRPSFVGS